MYLWHRWPSLFIFTIIDNEWSWCNSGCSGKIYANILPKAQGFLACLAVLEVPLILALMFKCTPQDLCKSLPFPAVSVRKYIWSCRVLASAFWFIVPQFWQKPLPLILLLRSTDWPNWLQYASIPLSPNTDYIWQHWLHCALYMCTSSSPVNLLMDFVGACQGNHRLQHPHPCVPCIVPSKNRLQLNIGNHGWLTLQNAWHHSGSWTSPWPLHVSKAAFQQGQSSKFESGDSAVCGLEKHPFQHLLAWFSNMKISDLSLLHMRLPQTP